MGLDAGKAWELLGGTELVVAEQGVGSWEPGAEVECMGEYKQQGTCNCRPGPLHHPDNPFQEGSLMLPRLVRLDQQRGSVLSGFAWVRLMGSSCKKPEGGKRGHSELFFSDQLGLISLKMAFYASLCPSELGF